MPQARAEPAARPDAADAAPAEDYGGLPPGDGREETHAICGACHSLWLVTQQGLDAERWDALMDWMTEKQGMAELEPDERRLIVGYLARHYGPERRSRGSAGGGMTPGMPMMAPPPMMPAMPPPPP